MARNPWGTPARPKISARPKAPARPSAARSAASNTRMPGVTGRGAASAPAIKPATVRVTVKGAGRRSMPPVRQGAQLGTPGKHG